MKGALWLVGLFAVAVAVALIAGANQGMVTLFWHPYRIDLSINFFLLLMVLGFFLTHYALRGISALFALPRQARRWRQLQKERAMHSALIDSLAQLLSGRYLRSRKSAILAIELQQSLQDNARHEDSLPRHLPQLRMMAELIAAETAHSLRDRQLRQEHYEKLIATDPKNAGNASVSEVLDAARLCASRWSLADHQPAEALQLLDQAHLGLSRRTLALRLRLKASRLAGQSKMALETARLLIKHGAFSEVAAVSLTRSLSLSCLKDCRDLVQLQTAWNELQQAERQNIEVSVLMAEKWLALDGKPTSAVNWLLPAWQQLMQTPETVTKHERARLIRAVEKALLASEPNHEWLARIDQACSQLPNLPDLQYLAGQIYFHHGLWGKAQQSLERILSRIDEPDFKQRACTSLANLAEQRNDLSQALNYWKQAAK